MNLFIHGRLGHFLMNEAGADGADAGGGATPADGADGQQAAAPAADTILGAPPAGEQGADPTKAEGEQNKTDDQAAKPVVPEKYAFENLPEGYELDEAATAEWSGVFKELGFTQEQVDKLVAMDAKRRQGMVQAYQQQMQQHRQQQLGEWASELQADPEFGGAKFEANVAIAQRALGEFGTPELSKALAETGMGSHPEVVRLFHRIGQQLVEGQLHRGSGNPSRKSNEEVFYGKP
ncbi:hypothetical protein [Pseudomonas sp. I2]|uniref:hypothetical protein n=1 Tax=Pseudomonas sp. I2 TaxID=1338438 RepID=UPI0034D629B5